MESGSSRSPNLFTGSQCNTDVHLYHNRSSDSLQCQKFNNHLQGHHHHHHHHNNNNINNNNMSFDWTPAPRQCEDHPQKQQQQQQQQQHCQRWSTYTADTSSTALESGSEDFSFSRKGARKLSYVGDDSATLLDASMERDQSPSLWTSPLPSAEDNLKTAIASMLSTANTLLISTMTARSDLARLQMMESVLDQHLDRREEMVLMEIENNNKMIKWMEQASEKLDRVLAESNFTFRTTETMSSTTSAAAWQRPGPSRAASRHWRAPSTTGQIDPFDGVSSLGIFDAKDESSTISKTAAKRLEKVLRRSSNISHTKTESNATAPDLASRFGLVTPSSAALGSTTEAPAAAASSSLAADAISASAASSETSEFRQRTPSITSDSGPSSLVSSREENSLSLPQALLTPQTPNEELPQQISMTQQDLSRHAGLGKKSISSLKSPNPIKASRHLSSAGIPNVSEAALGGLNWQEDQDSSLSSKSQLLGSKGALESLRKLNGGSSFLQTSSQQNSSPSPGWGGTFASWVGMSSPGS